DVHCEWRCFLFQAEDGIRYWSVTGVQTCALPISLRRGRRRSECRGRGSARGRRGHADQIRLRREAEIVGRELARDRERVVAVERSEERRVGREWRARG